MKENIVLSLNPADELLAELMAEYEKSLRDKEVSTRAVHLTHEVCVLLRGILDRTVRDYWEKYIAPKISEDDREAATVYFPIATEQNGFDSFLGRWRWKAVKEQHQPVYDYLLALQPFSNTANNWLTVLNDLAVKGKHIDLVPQKRTEQQRITVSRESGSVSWGPSVKFGSGVSVMGAPVDPRTQRIVPTPGVTERIETWISFIISGHDVDAAAFCKDVCRATRKIASEMSAKLAN